MEISIIIPVYNAEKYLERCLNSVLAATKGLKATVELLLVLDAGTNDRSAEIAKQYSRKHAKIVRVLSCRERGAGAVRNYGVVQARGKYIWFIDADDYIAKKALKRLLAVAEATGAELVMMGAERIHRGGKTSYLSAVDAKSKTAKSRFVRYGMGPWQVMVLRSWWTAYGFRFCEGIIHEDMELMSSLILHTDKFASVDEPLYYYCDNPESVLHKSKYSRHVYDIFPALEGLYRKFEEADAIEKYHDELEWFFIWNLLIDAAKDFEKFPEAKRGFQKSREILIKYFPKWRRNKFLKQKPLKLQLLVRLNYRKK